MTTIAEASHPTDRRVGVWFGEHLIADYTAAPDEAASFETATRRRFTSLRVTNQPAVVPDADLW